MADPAALSVATREPTSAGQRDNSSSTESGRVALVSKDGDRFVIATSAMMISELFMGMVDDGEDMQELHLEAMHSNAVAKVVEFCQHYQDEPMSDIPKPIRHGLTVGDHVQGWYSGYVAGLTDEMLFEVLLAANYLHLQPLLELCAATVGLRIINKTPDEIRQEFNITEAFSPEVERKLRDENKWSTEPPVSR